MKTESPEIRKRLQPNARRAEILDVARRAFARGGYSGVSMAAIAKESGVTPGLVNHYFGTKRDLYLSVIDESARHLSRLVRTDLGDLPTEERVAINTGEFLDSIKNDGSDWALLAGARAQGDPEVARRLERVRTETVERMARNQTGGSEPSDDLRMAMRLYQGMAEAAAGEWLSGRAERQQVETLMSTMLVAIVDAVAHPGKNS